MPSHQKYTFLHATFNLNFKEFFWHRNLAYFILECIYGIAYCSVLWKPFLLFVITILNTKSRAAKIFGFLHNNLAYFALECTYETARCCEFRKKINTKSRAAKIYVLKYIYGLLVQLTSILHNIITVYCANYSKHKKPRNNNFWGFTSKFNLLCLRMHLWNST